ncbi:MAG: gliding motility protein GldL [Bacteroidota bacterium]
MAGKKSVFFDKVLPTLYSVGAAVVIFGAWAKILHKDFADIMLTIGLLTEAAIFLTFAFQSYFQENAEYAWEKVYPELMDESPAAPKKSSGASLTAQMDAALANAKITPETFDNLQKGMKSLTDSVAKIGDITDATVATNEYAKNVKTAAGSMVEMNKAYGVTMNAMNEMSSATTDVKEYKTQFAEVTKKMGALNAVYELELQDTSKHLKAMNAFYGNLTAAMENMSDASKDTQQFKNELAKLTGNLTSLNGVYGSMLSAMKGN